MGTLAPRERDDVSPSRAKAALDGALDDPLPPAVEASVRAASWAVGLGVGVGGPLALFFACAALSLASPEGGAIANVVFWLGAPALIVTGAVSGGRVRRWQRARLQAALERAAPRVAGAVPASAAPVAAPTAGPASHTGT